MKVWIGEDEWYPHMTFDYQEDGYHRHDPKVDVDPETLARWEATTAAYRALQDELNVIYNATPKEPIRWG